MFFAPTLVFPSKNLLALTYLFYLFGPLCQICIADVQAPTKVVGIFRHNKSASNIAASLAIKMFNTSRQRLLDVSYESIQGDDLSNLVDFEIVDKLNNSIIVTGEPLICERLAKIIHEMTSFLVCYGTPTDMTYELMESNVYLTRPNPEAMVHCLFKLIKELIDEHDDSSSAFLVDKEHSYRHVAGNGLLYSLGEYKDVFEVIYLPQENQADILTNKSVGNKKLINAILHENEAKRFLCHSLHDNKNKENRSLIFVGLSNRQWLNSESSTECDTHYRLRKYKKHNCTLQELKDAAEGHLLLEYPLPSWTVSDKEHRNISVVRNDLRQRLQQTTPFVDYNDAPLAFDSVWAILRAVNSASKGNGQVSGESVERALIEKPYNGLTGENFSFIKYKNGSGGCVRDTVNAVINIYRFEKGSYVLIGRHNNTNNTFSWLHPLFPGANRHTWKPIQPKRSNSIMLQPGFGLNQMTSYVLVSLFLICHFQ